MVRKRSVARSQGFSEQRTTSALVFGLMIVEPQQLGGPFDEIETPRAMRNKTNKSNLGWEGAKLDEPFEELEAGVTAAVVEQRPRHPRTVLYHPPNYTLVPISLKDGGDNRIQVRF